MLSTVDLYGKTRVPNDTIVSDCTNSSHSDLLFSSCGDKENMQNQTVQNGEKLAPLLVPRCCLAGGAKIMFADGQEVKIEDIAIGNRIIIDFTHETATIGNVWRGIERDPLVQIKTKNGEILNCTALHPIATTDGIIAAGDIKKTHLLIDKKGNSSAIETIGKYPPCEVFNLSLVPYSEYRGMYPTYGMTMICNGLIVGDFNMQNSLC